MELNYKPKKAERLISREEEVGLLIFDPNTGNIKIMNKTAALIWDSIDGETSVGNLVKIVNKDNPDEEEELIRTDVLTFMEELQELAFIEERVD